MTTATILGDSKGKKLYISAGFEDEEAKCMTRIEDLLAAKVDVCVDLAAAELTAR